MGQTVNLLVFTFGGSNPSSPTNADRATAGDAERLQASMSVRPGRNAEVAQLIEHQPSKLRVASLSLVFRSKT